MTRKQRVMENLDERQSWLRRLAEPVNAETGDRDDSPRPASHGLACEPHQKPDNGMGASGYIVLPAIPTMQASYFKVWRDSPVCGCGRCPSRRDNPILVGFTVCVKEQERRQETSGRSPQSYRWLHPFGFSPSPLGGGKGFRDFNIARRPIPRLYL